MKFRTDRLLICPLSIDYLNEVHQLHSSPEVDRYNTLGIPASIESTKSLMLEWLQAQEALPPTNYVFCIKLIENNEFAGLIGLKIGKPAYRTAELWYKIDPPHWRKGYASEAVAEILKFAFSKLKLHRVEAGCAVDNTSSIRVLEKAGMIAEGRKREILPVRGKWLDNFFYAMLESDYEKLKGSSTS
ncbi:MAG: N-acetyltransferase [Chitinophagaceae bacterium]|nr:MAG: N-acetyltransferase [Chitinophagaceae bacterium]